MKQILISEEEHNLLLNLLADVHRMQKEILEMKRRSGLMGTNEFCKLLGISSRTAQNWRDRGIIDYVKIGEKIFYEQKALEEMLDRNRVKSFIGKFR